MKTRIMICSTLFLLFVLTGIAFGGAEGFNTYYGGNAGQSASVMDELHLTFIGNHSGYANTTGYENAFLGSLAGYSNITGYRNTFLGALAGYANSSGNDNTFVGNGAGRYTTTGADNTFLGAFAGYQNTLGLANVFVGVGTGDANTGGNYNTFLGTNAGYLNTTGSNNTAVGLMAGSNNITGNANIFLGYKAGFNETGSNKLYIDNSETSSPLIYGDFSANTLTVNGKFGIGTQAPVRQLHVVGDQAVFRMDRPVDTTAFMLVRTDGSGNPLKTFVVGANASGSNNGEFVINDLGAAVSGAGTRRMTISNSGSVNFPGAVTAASFTPVSSIAHKTNVKTYENALETVKKLRGVSFNWKDSGNPSVGLIAEEVDKVIPAVVAHNDKDATGVNYDSLVGVLVEAVKEQQAELDTLKEQKRINEEQQKIISAHSKEIAELKRLLIMSNAVSKAD